MFACRLVAGLFGVPPMIKSNASRRFMVGVWIPKYSMLGDSLTIHLPSISAW